MQFNVLDKTYQLVDRIMEYKGIDESVYVKPHVFLDKELETLVKINPRLSISYTKL